MFAGIRRRFRPQSVLWLTFMWALLWGEFSVGNIIAGLAVALGVTLLLPLPSIPGSGSGIRPGALLGLAGRFSVDLVASSVKVAVIALRPAPVPPGAIIVVPMRVQEDLVFSFAVTLLNLQPGGTVSDLDIADRKLTVHLIDGSSTKVIDREIERIARLERRLIHIFERNS
ncbi:Na+/H+ antiporter subunit E [Corynebacterium pygosceleis]|uniref:Na+/H+ antiporter subunit E n=1 Tax=Corynebacterium pygosceleis TaxID=2800406 RepID=A0A9Q4C9A1_9CORY|nr:Na+/H+ antiporter subunit E [Corynebacterium pygosceleis]MCK7638389.1 Na+/H+ antiporter subunit E [Corynebacterium pygosceleis]MCK7675369.1 Na+/H+ antiporter subunit E [Corynebacterium pygosceleis]MCL0121237.1 Na+/H+ antiporter subunit E [Corynebacterium pygosceleis]MCX7445452.1 Na+/H+ antiporter subunit E [Corynebacterium pygosceleis]MCX7469052.1 Na+/H+ antiporter subunit E [Corynebacterium pygosceleis]